MTPGSGRTTAWILGDQLTLKASSLEGLHPGEGTVLMIESLEHCRRLPFHKQKLVLVWSAMRHFAEELRSKGYHVDYYARQASFAAALKRHVKRHRPARLRLMESAEFGVAERLAKTATGLALDAAVTPNTLFLSDKRAFQRESSGKKSRVMEAFYRKMRKHTGILMDGRKPRGGRWNYDAENRRPPAAGLDVPPIPRYAPDAITARVQRLVDKEFPNHFGRCDSFAWPVTRADAEAFLEDFLDHRLPQFGPYQDAMITGERALFHSLLSPLLNLGLLEPLDVCRRAEARLIEGKAPVNSVAVSYTHLTLPTN